MMKITINNLSLSAFVGIHDFEKRMAQEIFVTIELEVSNVASLFSDLIEDTINYDIVVETITNTVKKKHYNLIEHLAYSIISEIKNLKDVNFCEITVKKPNAVKNADFTAVTLSSKLVY